jgi:hypothetical protein
MNPYEQMFKAGFERSNLRKGAPKLQRFVDDPPKMYFPISASRPTSTASQLLQALPKRRESSLSPAESILIGRLIDFALWKSLGR